MSQDHLNEEGPAELEEIKMLFNIIFLLSILLTISYGIHFNGHFYIFGLLARILFWTYEFWTIIQDALFYWYFLFYFHYDIRQKETSSDSTQSRDRQIDIEDYQQILPEAPAPNTEVLLHIRPQINFLWNSHINEIPSIYWQYLAISLILHRISSIYPCMPIFCIYLTHQKHNRINN